MYELINRPEYLQQLIRRQTVLEIYYPMKGIFTAAGVRVLQGRL